MGCHVCLISLETIGQDFVWHTVFYFMMSNFFHQKSINVFIFSSKTGKVWTAWAQQKVFIFSAFMFVVEGPVCVKFEIDKQQKGSRDKTDLENLFDIYVCQQEL